MIILGVETSCDETAISIIEANGDLDNLHFEVLGSAVNSQIDIHKEYGGVFPTLAKREHIKNLPIVYTEAMEKAKIKETEIDLIAVTVGPGLEPALWTGINFAQELGKKLGVETIGANHMLGHITSVLFKTDEMKDKKLNPLDRQAGIKNNRIKFPAVALLISGGHTELVFLKSWLEIEKLGETLDDAIGEAFDKVARMLGLPYPGGPEISKLAEEAREQNIKSEKKFPRPMINSKDYNFSFSGLKTAVLYYLRNLRNSSANESCECIEKNSREFFSLEAAEPISQVVKLIVAREFEDAAIETLISKTKKAIEAYNPKTLIIGGGVIANKSLRENFLKLNEIYKDLEILIPDKSLTTDNATMIAASGYIEYLNKRKPLELKAQGNLNII